MGCSRVVGLAAVLAVGLMWNHPAAGQSTPAGGDEGVSRRWPDLALTTNCEAGFRRFIHMAQTGQLGRDVTNANVGILKNHVRVELVRGGTSNKLLLLTPKSGGQTMARYFNIEPGEGATATDVARVGQALDEAFDADPFELAYDFFNAVPAGDPIPRLADAWAYGGWAGVMRTVERRMAALVGPRYTIAVIVGVGASLLASLVLLWGSTPRPVRSEPSTGPGGPRVRNSL